MISPTQARGAAFEQLAADWLAVHGLRVLTRGYRCRGGELDLVCRDGDALVVVEVRSRRSRSHGGAAASIDSRKRRRIVLATRHFLMTHPELAGAPVRFDVIAIDGTGDGERTLRWIPNAFDVA